MKTVIELMKFLQEKIDSGEIDPHEVIAIPSGKYREYDDIVSLRTYRAVPRQVPYKRRRDPKGWVASSKTKAVTARRILVLSNKWRTSQ